MLATCIAAVLVAAAIGAVLITRGGRSGNPLAGDGRTPAESSDTTGAPTPDSPTPDSTGSPGVGPGGVRSTLLAAHACVDPCTITGDVPFVHPVHGPSTLYTILDGPFDASAAAVADSGEVFWSAPVDGILTSFAPAPTPIDAIGHIFLSYSMSGTDSGISVVAPDGDGMNDFHSLPGEGQRLNGRFHPATVADPGAGGAFDIEVTADGDEPMVFEWAQGDYQTRDVVGVLSCSSAFAPVPRPTVLMDLDCQTDRGWVSSLSWDSWGGDEATASGTYFCRTACRAAGPFLSSATVAVSDVRTVDGLRLYTHIHVEPRIADPIDSDIAPTK